VWLTQSESKLSGTKGKHTSRSVPKNPLSNDHVEKEEELGTNQQQLTAAARQVALYTHDSASVVDLFQLKF
jgi:hypothetical protein